MCHFDGHTVGVYKNEIIELAKGYEIDLEEAVEKKCFDDEFWCNDGGIYANSNICCNTP